MTNELRWKQRFQNFEKSFLLLNKVANNSIEELSDLEKAGLIQYFEILIELSWKVMKDYLENDGYDNMGNGKKTIRQAFADGFLISDNNNAQKWMNALQQRNLTSHIYDDTIQDQTINFIKDEFYPLVNDLYNKLKK